MLLAVFVTPAAPAAAGEEGYWRLVSQPVEVRRDGVSYQMWLWIEEYASFGEQVRIMVQKTRNPDGAAKATQENLHSFPMDEGANRFRHPEINLSTASLDTDAQMDQYGRIDITFDADRTLNKMCDGRYRTRGGTLDGAIAFNTGTDKFGTIRAVPTRATLTFSDGGCPDDGGGGGGGTPCPTPGRNFGGTRFFDAPMTMNASTNDGAETANIFWQVDRALGDEGRVTRILRAIVHRSKFRLTNDLSSGSVQSMPGIWLTGQATYTGQPASNTEPTPCGTGMERFSKSNAGMVTGNMAVDFFMGPDSSISQRPVDGASAFRYVVRPQ